MALPKLDVPIYETTLISTGKKVKFRPFLVKEQKLFLMASQSDDPKEMVQTLKQVLTNCIVDKVDIENLPTFDLEHLFIQLRAKSVGEVVNMRYTCNNLVKKEDGTEKKCGGIVQFDLNLTDITPIKNENHKTKIQLTENMGIMMKYPNLQMLKNFDENKDDFENTLQTIVSCIEYIYDKDKIYYSKDSTKEELIEFVESMQQDDLEKIKTFFDTMPKMKKDLHFKCNKCGYEEDIVVEGIQNFFV